MKTLLADIHMHTLASGHAYGTIREMAAAARDRGLALIGVSEHAPGIPGTPGRSTGPQGRPALPGTGRGRGKMV